MYYDLNGWRRWALPLRGPTVHSLVFRCDVAAFLVTSPIYYWLRLPRTKVWIVVHAALGTVGATVFFWAGVPMRLESLLPHGSLSNNGVPEIVVLTALVAIFPYTVVMGAHFAYERMRRVSGPGWGE